MSPTRTASTPSCARPWQNNLPKPYAVIFADEGSVAVQMVEFGYGGEVRVEGSPDYADRNRQTMVR